MSYWCLKGLWSVIFSLFLWQQYSERTNKHLLCKFEYRLCICTRRLHKKTYLSHAWITHRITLLHCSHDQSVVSRRKVASVQMAFWNNISLWDLTKRFHTILSVFIVVHLVWCSMIVTLSLDTNFLCHNRWLTRSANLRSLCRLCVWNIWNQIETQPFCCIYLV